MFKYDTQEETQAHTSTVGSFYVDRDADFKAGIRNLMESFSTNVGMFDPIQDISRILSMDNIRESYKEQLIGDVLTEGQFADDPYLSTMPAKLEQLFENSSMEILRESYVGQLAPIVGISLPVLKKNYLECHSKDVVMMEVPAKPIIKASFERKFLKDSAGNKYYIPEIFYDDAYKSIVGEMTGAALPKDWFPQSGNLPFQDLNLVQLAGGTHATRDKLALDFHIEGIRIELDGTGATPTPEIKELTGLRIVADMGTTTGAPATGTISYRLKTTDAAGQPVEDVISGMVDFYNGTVSIACTGGRIKQVRFGGHLSNENNVRSVELDRERENLSWNIPDGKRINTGLPIERVKDYKSVFSIDYVSDTISDISQTLTQFEDSDVFAYLDNSLARWRGKTDLPFGYDLGFVETYKFNATPPAHGYITPSSWVNTELKFNFNREVDELKTKLRTTDVMFVAYGHPNNISLIQDDVKWVIDEDTKVGGVQLDYRFGVMTANKNRIHVVTSMKVPKSAGIRIVAYPTSPETVTFKHYKYSLNIENMYRNPNTPNIPNVMGTSRYLTTDVLPVQGEFLIEGNEFGRQ